MSTVASGYFAFVGIVTHENFFSQVLLFPGMVVPGICSPEEYLFPGTYVQLSGYYFSMEHFLLLDMLFPSIVFPHV